MAQRTVLLVDGDMDSCAIYRAVLHHHGYRVVEASGGEEGLQLVRAERPDLVILEFPILLLDGRLLTKLIKSDPSTASIQVLTITSRAFESEIEKARAAGSDACLTKPVWPQRVLEEVERLIGPAHASSHAEPANHEF